MAGGDNNTVVIPISIGEEAILTESLQIIKIVRPEWDSETLNHKVFTDGITNKLVGFYVGDNRDDMVIVKVYGANTETIIDREIEISTMRLLHDKGCGPALYAVFNNGICYEFIPGDTLTVDSCRDAEVYPIVAAETARLHSKVPFEGSDGPSPISHMWDKLKNFNDQGEDILKANPILKEKLDGFGVPAGWGRSAIQELETIFATKEMPITFCHNDLLLGNVIYNQKISKVSFIDFEYAMPNFAPYDVANHFNEFAGIEGADFSLCPDRAFKSKWIKEYLAKLDIGRTLDQETFEEWVELCIPASHLFWTLWALVQAQHSTINFDYAGYFGLRFLEYEKLMKPIREQEGLPSLLS